jgi:cell division septation protein DedD
MTARRLNKLNRMPKNEEGEFELVVGNKQLLSIFFIVMVLFGVVFSMGYFVGRNTSEPAAAQSPDPSQQVHSGVPALGERAPAATPPQAPPADPGLAPGEAKVTETQSTTPAGGAPAPAAASTTSAPAEQPKPAPPAKAAEPVKQPAPAPPAATASVFEPKPGQVYLQVAAVKRPEAELIVDVLKKRGLAAIVAPVSTPQPPDALWRALVGPLKDAGAVSKARTDLEAAGFKQAIVRKY